MTVVVEGQRITALGKTGHVQIPKGARSWKVAQFLIPSLGYACARNFWRMLPENKEIIPLLLWPTASPAYATWRRSGTVEEWRADIADGKMIGRACSSQGPCSTVRFRSFQLRPISNAADGRRVVDELVKAA